MSLEGSELSEKIGQLKMEASDGKLRITDVVNTKDLLRLVQSIPSPKAEPFKMWLASCGSSLNASNKNLLEIKSENKE